MLNLKFDKRKNKSVPEQLVEAIKTEISLHHFATHSELAEMDVFAKQYQISLEDTNWVYETLIKEDLVIKKEDKYYFTDFEIPSIFFDNVHSILDIIEKNNYKASFKDLTFEVIDFPLDASKLIPKAEGPAVHIERLFYGDGRPVLLSHFYYSLKRYPSLDKVDVKNKMVWKILREKYKAEPNNVKMNFHVVRLNNRDKQLLETEFNYAHNVKSCIKDQDDELLEYSEIYLKIDEISFRFDTEI